MLAVVQHRRPAQRERVRRLLPFISLALFIVFAGPSRRPPSSYWEGGHIDLMATPVALDPKNPAHRRVGELTYLRGWHLTSSFDTFGGLSALRRWRGRWLAVLDAGGLLTFTPYERTAALRALSPRCRPNRVRLGYDLEGLDTDGLRIWVSSEWHNTICRLDPDGRQTGTRPPAMKHWPRYSGPETLLRLSDGRFLVMPEDSDFPALIFPHDPIRGGRPRRVRYTPPAGYVPTDATLLPDGRLAVLNRKFGLSGFANKIVLFDGIPDRGSLHGRVIATLAAPLIHDNFEGISARREGDATVLSIVSDDNNSRWQRTLLLEFRLDETPDANRPRAGQLRRGD